MKLRNIKWAIIFFSVACFPLVGCGGISVQKIVPDTMNLENRRVQKSLMVLEVKGAQKEIFGGPEMISNDEFKEALVLALKKSNLFRKVNMNENGDLGLTAEIIAQGQGNEGLAYTSALVVEYRIIETKTKEEVWRKSFNSRHKATVADAFSGATRTTMAQEGSARKNIAQLLESVSKFPFK